MTSSAVVIPAETTVALQAPPTGPGPPAAAGVTVADRVRSVVGDDAERAIAAGTVGADIDPTTAYATRLHAAQEALRESEARYHALTALSSDWYWEQDAQQRFTRVSEHGQDRSGIVPSAIIGKTRWETGIGYDAAERAALEAAMAAHRPFYDFQFTRAGAEGALRQISISGEPMVDASGRYLGYRGIGKDITERKRAQAAAEESQRFAHATLDALDDHVCVQDASGTIVMVNRAWRRFLAANGRGVTGDFVGANYLAACDNATGDARVDGLAAGAGIRAVISGESEHFRHEYRCDAPNEVRWFAMKVTRFPRADAVRVVIAHENITERRQAATRIERSGTLYRALGETNDAIIRIRGRTELLREVAAITARIGHFNAVKIWMREPGSTRIHAVVAKARSGDDLDDVITTVDLSGRESDAPTGVALSEGRPDVCDELDRDRMARWRRAGAPAGSRSGAAFPLREDGEVVGALSMYSEESGYFDPPLVLLLERIAAALSLALDNLKRDAERKAAEAALRESEARFRSLTKLSADWYWQQDETLRFTSLCNGTEISAGLQPEADLGKARWELDGAGAADWPTHRATLAARQPFRDFEFERTFPDGSVRDTSVSGEPIVDDDGRFAGYRGVGRDVTERKRAERILALEHRVERSLADADTTRTALEAVIRAVCEIQGWACGVYFVADDDAGLLRASHFWAAPGGKGQQFIDSAHGMQIDRDTGISGQVWRSGEPLWIPDLAADPRALHRDQILKFGARGAFSFPSTLGSRTIGVFIFFSAIVRQPDERLLAAARVIGGQVGQFLQRRRAEEALRDSEARYRALTELSADWYWEHDEHQRFTRMSAGTDVGAGVTLRGIHGRTRWETAPDYDPQRRAALDAEIDARRPFRDFEYRRMGADGVAYDVQISGEPMYDEAGRYCGYRGVGRDVSERRQAEGQQRFQALLLSTVGEAVIATDTDGRITYWSASAEQLYGWSAAEAIGANVLDITRTDESRIDALAAMRQVAIGRVWRGEMLARRRNGETLPIQLTLAPIPDAGGAMTGLIGVSRDISELKRAEKAIRDNARQQSVIAAFGQRALASTGLTELFERAALAVAEGLDVAFCTILQLAPDRQSLVAKAGLGWDEGWLDGRVMAAGPGTQGRYVLDAGAAVVVDDFASEDRFVPVEFAAPHHLRSGVDVAIGGGGGPFGVLGAYSRDAGRFRPQCVDFLQSIANTLATAIDRRAAEEKLAHLAQFDSLTNLPNRSLLRDRLARTMAQVARHHWSVAVMFIDLDGFKEVNDTFGHDFGDELLIRVARRLEACVRDGDTVGRQGGDEFAIVLSGMARADDANVVAQHVLAGLARPFDLGGHQVRVTASIGIAIYPGDGDTPELLLKNADTAMYRAKNQGRNSFRHFTEELDTRSPRRMAL